MPAQYATIGGLREDYFITPDKQVHLHKLGGNAVYSAAGAALWAERVGIVSRVGSNYPSEWLDEIGQMGIRTDNVVVLPTEQDTRTFYAYINETERTDITPRKHFKALGLRIPPELEDYLNSTMGQDKADTFDPLAIRPSDVVQVGGDNKLVGVHLAPFYFVTHRTVPSALRMANVKIVTLDPSVRYMQPDKQREIREIITRLDAFLPSEMEVLSYFRRDKVDMWEAAETFADMGAKIVVIKRGAKRQYVYERATGRRWQVPAYPARVVDVTGAGDAYCGGFMIGLCETGDAVEAALRGTVAASIVIEGTGALYALSGHPGLAQARLTSWRSEVRRL